MLLSKDGDFYYIKDKPYIRTTRAIGIMGMPGLVPWAVKRTAEAGAELGEIPDVETLQKLGMARTREAADRGTAIHEFIAMELTGIKTVGHFFHSYIAGAQEFLDDYNIEVEAVEQVFLDEALGYAGTVDLWGSDPEGHLLVDWKTGRQQPMHELQLNAYANCTQYMSGDLLEETPVFQKGITVYLKEDGSYKADSKYFTDEAFDAFAGLLAAYRWLEGIGHETG